MAGSPRSLFDGGATFHRPDMRKAGVDKPGPIVFQAMRQHYVVAISGNQDPSDKLRITVSRPEKLSASALVLE